MPASLRCASAIVALASGLAAQAQTFHRLADGEVVFSKAAFADVTDPANWDRISDTVAITRDDFQGIYNPLAEAGYVFDFSPGGTLWNFGATVDDVINGTITLANFDDWENAHGNNPPGTVGTPAVVYLQDDDAFVEIMFTSWGGPGSGGSFSYRRARFPTPRFFPLNDVSNSTIPGSFPPDGDFGGDVRPETWNLYTFVARAGDTIDWRVDRTTDALDPVAAVYPGNLTGVVIPAGITIIGNPVQGIASVSFSDDENPSATGAGPFRDPAASFVAPVSGQYTIAVASFGSEAGAQEYNVIVNGCNYAPLANIINGMASGSFGPRGDFNGEQRPGTWDAYVFDANAGDTVEWRVDRTTDALDPVAAVYEENASGMPIPADAWIAADADASTLFLNAGGFGLGTPISFGDDNNPPATGSGPFGDPSASFVAPFTGTYALLIASFASAPTGDQNYNVLVSVTPPFPCNAADVAPEFGTLNVNDIIDFVNAFNGGLALADVSPAPSGDGLLNVNDVIDFVNAFNAGCP